ncbi:tetratricopeptide repeat protein [Scytonema sp. PCC 10023]|uniref:tetratricopeptide repeat protein n=1 Tax=Scytonema sp. PCC 10023 TaxID=1680591 RepID=UPI0039C5C283
MSQPTNSDSNQSPKPGINQQANDSTLGGGMQGVNGNDNIVIQIVKYVCSGAGGLTSQKPSEDIEQAILNATNPTPKTRIVMNQSIPSVPVWKGRDELLKELLAKLLLKKTEFLEENWFLKPLKVLALIGQGGIGKTSLAVKLLEVLGINLDGRAFPTSVGKGRNLADCPYERVIYFKAQEGISFDDVAEFLLKDGLSIETTEVLNKADNKIAKIIEGLTQTRCLVVLDNLETILHPATHPQVGRTISSDWGKLLNALVYQQHKSQTILTSREVPADLADRRYQGVEPDSELVHIETLTGVTTEAAMEILQQRQLKDNLADLQWVSEHVGGHVFLLTQLASIGKGKPGYLRKHPELVTKKVEPILREQLARQNDATQDLLRRMCVLRVSIDIQGLTFLRLHTDQWDICFPSFSPFSPLMIATDLEETANFTEIEISETEASLKQLVDSSLVQCHYDEQKCKLFYDLHQVVVEFLRSEYKDQMSNLFKIAYHFYISSYDFHIFGNNDNSPQTPEDLQPVLEAQYFAFQLKKYDDSLKLLRNVLFKYFRRWGYWKLLKERCEEIIPYIDKFQYSIVQLEIGYAYFQLGDLDIAKNSFYEIVNREQKRGIQQDLALSLYMLGNVELEMRNLDAAEVWYQKSLQLWEKFYNPLNITIIWSSLGHIESNRGNLDKAEELYLQALQLREKLDNRPGEAISLSSLGDIQCQRGNLNEAERFYGQALEIYTELGEQSRIASLYASLGYLERKRSNWDAAKKQYERSLTLRTKLGERTGIATSIGSLGRIELDRGNLETADKHLKDALVKMQELGLTWHIAETNYSLAQLERQRGNTELAQQHYNSAHQNFQELGAVKDLERIERGWNQPPNT